MKKLLAILVAGMFASGAFAQAAPNTAPEAAQPAAAAAAPHAKAAKNHHAKATPKHHHTKAKAKKSRKHHKA